METKSLLARVGSVGLLLVLVACGGAVDEDPTDASFRGGGTAYTPTTTPIGNFNVKCGGSPAQQVQQKIPYQQQQQSSPSCSPQFRFYSAVATDFDVDLDCRKGRVIVTAKGLDQPSIVIPIQNDGSWQGQLVVNQAVENDGRGNVYCKIKTIVNFNGRASCVSGQEGIDWGTSVSFASADHSVSTALLALEAALPRATATPEAPETPDTPDGFEMPGAVESTPTAEPLPSPSATEASPSPSVSPTVSPSRCAFSNPRIVNSRTLEITIPAEATDLGCSAFGSGAYSVLEGTAVTWINRDSRPHSVTSDDDSADSFDSGPIPPGKSYTHVFEFTGSSRYHSALDANMQGLITVRTGPIVLPTESPTPTLTPTPTPTISPSPRPTPSPMPTSSPKPSHSPGTIPSPSATQIVSCVVVNPCPIYAETSQKCPLPAQQ